MAAVELSERARERPDDLDAEPRDRIIEKLKDIREWPDHYLEPLNGSDAYKLRVGDCRVIIDWDRDDETLPVLTLGHRRNIYDRDPDLAEFAGANPPSSRSNEGSGATE